MISPPGESPVVLYTRDLSPERGCLSLCGNVEDLTGYPAAAFLDDPKFWNQRIHPNDKPQALDALRLCLRVGSAAIDYRFLRQDGVYVWIHDSCSLISKDKLPRGIAGTWIDITRQKKYAERLTNEDHGEKVTGLVNRKTFERSLAALIADAVNSNNEHVLCYIDLDQFRVINNTCGHTAGDELLRQLGWYLQGKLRVRDTVAYLGGDEFGILLESCVIRQDNRVFAGIRQALTEFEFELAGRKISITASIGVVPINKESGSPARVLGMADIACYAAKERGRDRVHFYTEEDEDSEPRIEMFWVDRINQAMQEDRFFLYSQPIVPLNGAGLGGHHELLLRMKDEAGKLVPPGLFLPAAERYHLAGRIDQWVIRTALSWLDAYADMIDPAQRIGINISGQSLANDDLLEFVLGELTHKGIAPERIYFEITETAAVANFKHAIRFINGLRDRGCHFALDDFGSGVSSFAYLKMLPVDYLKIDGAFVKEIANSPVDYAMVKAINDVGRTMGKQTIAEFVENDAIVAKLKEIGVDFAQGYGIGKPRPLNEFFNP